MRVSSVIARLAVVTLAVSGVAAPVVADELPRMQHQKIFPDDFGSPDYHVGRAVALDGDTIVMGGYGSAYVFVRGVGGQWEQQAELLPTTGSDDDGFGVAVAVDGDLAVVGAVRDDDVLADTGAAYVFARSGTSWSEEAKLLPIGGGFSDQFGVSVAISGGTVVVGANQNGPTLANGKAYVFTRDPAPAAKATTWSQQQELASTATPYVGFGTSVAVDGDRILVGAPGWSPGAVYVFTRSGVVWTEQARIDPPDGPRVGTFGSAVALDGTRALIGDGIFTEGGLPRGAAYAYDLTGTANARAETWTFDQRLRPDVSSSTQNDRFGQSVALDGTVALIGSSGEGGRGAGHLFSRNGVWAEVDTLAADDGVAGDRFATFSIDLEGETAVVGAPDADIGFVADAGAVYVFGRPLCEGLPITVTGQTDGDDELVGTDGDDVIHGMGGDDTIDGMGGNDTICGGDGNDTIRGGDGDDTLRGGTGHDSMWGEAGEDTLMGNRGRDRLSGGADRDVLYGGRHGDRLFGDGGNDVLHGLADDDFLSGGDGNDRIFGRIGDDEMEGGAGNDLLMGLSGDDVIRGDEGDDRLSGRQGADDLDGDDGDDEILGGTEPDVLRGGAGADLLLGHEGDDLIYGGGDDDRLVGGDGDDTLDGGSGSDVLVGEGGTDTCMNGSTVRSCEL